MKRLIIILLLGAHLPLWAGRYGDAFLQAALPPAITAAGNSLVCSVPRYGTVWSNPAALAMSSAGTVAGHLRYWQGLSLLWLIEADLPQRGPWRYGLTWVRAGVDGIAYRPDLFGLDPQERRDSVRVSYPGKWGYFSDRESALLFALARKYRFHINLGWRYYKIPVELPVGLSFKLLHKALADNSAWGFGLDLGVQAFLTFPEGGRFFRNSRLAVGWKLEDVNNTPIYWHTRHQDALTRSLVWGFGWQQSFAQRKYRLELTMARNAFKTGQTQFGLRFFTSRVYIAVGYDGYQASGGFGLQFSGWGLQYALTPNELALTHTGGLYLDWQLLVKTLRKG